MPAAGVGPVAIAPCSVPGPRFKLQYAMEDAGPNGPATVELWMTQDGGSTWSAAPRTRPGLPIEVDLGGEGTYGSAWWRGRRRAGDQPPAPGDPPQTWVEVDTTPRRFSSTRLRSARVHIGQGGDHLASQRSAPRPPLGLAVLASRPAGIGLAADHRRAGEHGPVHLDRPAQPSLQVPHPGRGDRYGGPSRRRRYDRTGPVIVDRSRPRSRIIGLDPNARAGDGPGARPLR